MASASGLLLGYGQPTISIKPFAGDSGDFDQWQNQVQQASSFTQVSLLSPDAQNKLDKLVEERDKLLGRDGEETMKNTVAITYRETNNNPDADTI